MSTFQFIVSWLFMAGFDTAEIADVLRQRSPATYRNLTEATVANALAAVRDMTRAKAVA